jgi:hypothetical protein
MIMSAHALLEMRPMARPLSLRVEPTGEPDAVRIVLNRRLAARESRFDSRSPACDHPLAQALLAIPGVRAVHLHGCSMTVRKRPAAQWRTIGPAIQTRLHQLLK